MNRRLGVLTDRELASATAVVAKIMEAVTGELVKHVIVNLKGVGRG